MILQRMQEELSSLRKKHNFRILPSIHHEGRVIQLEGRQMLNLSSNDYLGLATDQDLREEFFATLTPEHFLPSSSSSRLLTGNYEACEELENRLTKLYGTESALVFSSGYHANTGILPAIADSKTLILADKLVHASIIDGIRLSSASCIRYRHNHYEQLERLLKENSSRYETVIIVTESIFSMDGDEADLSRIVSLKEHYPNLLLYVDEAHAVGVRGAQGLGCAEEQGCVDKIDILIGTFGKAFASVGAFVVCRDIVKNYLVNRMRTLIFTTALPPVTLRWTSFILNRITDFSQRREHLNHISTKLREALLAKGYPCTSTSHIIPLQTGDSGLAIDQANELQRKGFYALPVRPPTVPEGTSRIRFSLTANLHEDEVGNLIACLGIYSPHP